MQVVNLEETERAKGKTRMAWTLAVVNQKGGGRQDDHGGESSDEPRPRRPPGAAD